MKSLETCKWRHKRNILLTSGSSPCFLFFLVLLLLLMPTYSQTFDGQQWARYLLSLSKAFLQDHLVLGSTIFLYTVFQCAGSCDLKPFANSPLQTFWQVLKGEKGVSKLETYDQGKRLPGEFVILFRRPLSTNWKLIPSNHTFLFCSVFKVEVESFGAGATGCFDLVLHMFPPRPCILTLFFSRLHCCAES